MPLGARVLVVGLSLRPFLVTATALGVTRLFNLIIWDASQSQAGGARNVFLNCSTVWYRVTGLRSRRGDLLGSAFDGCIARTVARPVVFLCHCPGDRLVQSEGG